MMRWLPVGLGSAVIACALAAVAFIQAGGTPACAATLVPANVTGTATHYVLASGGGNCSYPAPQADGLYVALSPAEYASAAACGSYLEVTGPDGSVPAEVVDQCPPCRAGHIDLSATAFARIAPLSAGQVTVTYRTIADPVLPGRLSFLVKGGSSAYWLALLVVNTGNAVTSVQARSASHGWQDLARANYNYWIAQSGLGAGPFTVRVTDTSVHRVTVSGIALDPGVVQPTGTLMYGVTQAVTATPSARATHKAVTRRAVTRRTATRRTTQPGPGLDQTASQVETEPSAGTATPSPAPASSCQGE
jgi:expansin (peptidoglycan-binding protein)